jgi:hypothetical protein
MKKLRLYPLFLLLLFSANIFAQQSGEKKGWPSNERYAFIIECIGTAKAGMTEDAARFYCYCMQDKVEKKYPTIGEASKISNDDLQTPEWLREIKACVSGSNWKTKDRSDFMTNCIATAKGGVGEEKAKTYCECMLYKIESRYPDPEEATKLTAEDLASPEWKKIAQGCLDF